ncbi:Carboxy-terminal-processing protease [Geodia barretti]|uniref:Carboxy-terminal-processing protease n=1 Tax=Geodia barretti TaxID=519541 RepID=A0AA35WS67_GEOBA|nr:Carboxy-terminal-processing protease [Geodia barretti]
MLQKALIEAIRKADVHYYEDVDQQEMFEGAIKGALTALDDPYTFYLPPVDQKREEENLYHAKFGGLGIRIYEDKGFIKIARPLPNTPAMRVGLQAGDYITKVDGEPIHISAGGQTLAEVVDILRGLIGTEVTVTVQRRGHSDPFDVTLIREEIKITSVKQTMLEDGIGYIKIESFTGRTVEEFKKALKTLLDAEDGAMTALILDLRHNSGGLLQAAYDVADAFISRGNIVSTQGRLNRYNQEYPATPETLCPAEIELVVLVNEYSASGSEIVAGAIKDSKRGAILGKKTFGKGVVQQRFPLNSLDKKGAVSLTISTYYTPSGVSINETGIEPNVEVEMSKLDEVTAAMRLYARKYVETFVEEWIERTEKEMGKTPKDFSQLEAELPDLMTTLAEHNITLDMEIIKNEANAFFNRNVGLDPLIDLVNDNQLLDAIQLIKTGGVEAVLASSTTVDL